MFSCGSGSVLLRPGQAEPGEPSGLVLTAWEERQHYLSAAATPPSWLVATLPAAPSAGRLGTRSRLPGSTEGNRATCCRSREEEAAATGTGPVLTHPFF